MNDLNETKSGVFKRCLIIAFVSWLISIPVIGVDVPFACGLVLGTSVSILNFYIILFCGKRVLDNESIALSVIGYGFRMVLYVGVFYVCIKVGWSCVAGATIGFLTLKVSLYYTLGFKPKFSESSVKGKPLNDLDNDAWAKAHEEEKEKKKKKKGRFASIFSSDDLWKDFESESNKDDGEKEE